jgi:hypothetical protein
VANIPGSHQIGDRADRVLDGDVGVEPPRPVDIDVIDAQPGQCARDKALLSVKFGALRGPDDRESIATI